MAFNGSGVYVLPATSVTPAVSSTTIDSADFNTFTADLETALSLCLTEDGQNVPTANLPMATYRHTGVGDGAALTDYASVNQVVDNALTYGGASAAGTDTYAVNLSINPGAYVAGNRYQFIADVANTGACTINFNSIGAKSIVMQDGSALPDNYIIADSIVDVEYDGVDMVLMGVPSVGVNTASAQILSNKTHTDPTINLSGTGTIADSVNSTSIDAVYDEDDMTSDDANGLATQQSIKAYVDNTIQVVTAADKVYQSTTSRIPVDDTIPAITEGLSLVDVTITPKYTDSTLVFHFSGLFSIKNVTDNAKPYGVVSLIDVTSATCLTAQAWEIDGNDTGASWTGNFPSTMTLHRAINSPGTSANTYRIRVGVSGTTNQTLYCNGNSSARVFGGVAECRLTVTEIR
jgi:hypothetical protein